MKSWSIAWRRRPHLLVFASKSQTRRTALKQHSSGFIIGIVASIILGFGVVAGIFLGLRSIGGLGYEPTVLRADKTGPNSATLTISTFPYSQVCHPDAPTPHIAWVTSSQTHNY